MVIVYTQPNCSPCRQVKSWLDSKGVEYVEKDITRDTDAYQRLLELGHRATPTIQTDTDSWVGVNLAKMKELVHA